MIQLVKQYKDEEEGEDTWGTSVAEQIGEEDEAMKLYDLYLSSRPTVPSSSIHTELDLYLEEASLPRTQELDIINWWEVSGSRFPTLQKLARDILPIPITSVASECAFSTSGRVLSAHRSRLTPNVAEALMCMQAWSRADLLGNMFYSTCTCFLLLCRNLPFTYKCLLFHQVVGILHSLLHSRVFLRMKKKRW